MVGVAFAVGSLVAVASDENRSAIAAQREASEERDGLLTYEADGFRYVYQIVTGDEALFELRADPRRIHNLAGTRPELTREMRRALEARLRVADLDSLRGRCADTIRTLKSLGYL